MTSAFWHHDDPPHWTPDTINYRFLAFIFILSPPQSQPWIRRQTDFITTFKATFCTWLQALHGSTAEVNTALLNSNLYGGYPCKVSFGVLIFWSVERKRCDVSYHSLSWVYEQSLIVLIFHDLNSKQNYCFQLLKSKGFVLVSICF